MRRLAGQPLSATDGMIAATAFEHGLTLVTRNEKEFTGLGVTVINPWPKSKVIIYLPFRRYLGTIDVA
jgi:predicted nucleic acid-binding protein